MCVQLVVVCVQLVVVCVQLVVMCVQLVVVCVQLILVCVSFPTGVGVPSAVLCDGCGTEEDHNQLICPYMHNILLLS